MLRFNGYLRNEGTRYDENWKWVEPKYRKRYLNKHIYETKVILMGSWVKDNAADECISCLDIDEVEELIEEMKEHYRQYRFVKIVDNINIE